MLLAISRNKIAITITKLTTVTGSGPSATIEISPDAPNKVNKKFPTTVVGWNSSDDKVKMIDVWSHLSRILPDKTTLYSFYYSDSYGLIDTKYEINSSFFEKII